MWLQTINARHQHNCALSENGMEGGGRGVRVTRTVDLIGNIIHDIGESAELAAMWLTKSNKLIIS